MKTIKYLAITCLISSIGFTSYAQSGFGIKLGLGTQWENVKEQNGLSSADYSYSLGFFLRLGGEKSFYFQPEFLWSSSTARLNFEDETTGEVTGDIISSKLNSLKIPALFGFHFFGHFLDIQVGPIATVILDQDQTVGLGGVARNLQNFNLGYQAGIGVNLGNFTADLRYQEYFDNEAISQFYPRSIEATIGIRIF